MKKHLNYYSKISDKIFKEADHLKKLLESDSYDNTKIMNTIFKQYWDEFVIFWKQTGETVEWMTFALAPHNSIMFTMYTLKEHPEVRNVLKEYVLLYENKK